MKEALRFRLSITGIGLGVAASGMLFSMIALVMPVLKQEQFATVLQLQWIMNILGIFVCSTLVICGRLADIFGHKKVYLIGLSMIVVGVGVDTFAQSVLWIIAMQALTGTGNAIMLSCSQAMISHEYSESERARAIGVWASMVGIALALGPVLGGVLISAWGWRSVFATVAVIGLLAILIIAIFSNESKNIDDPPKLDFPGAIVLMIALATLVLAIVQYNTWPLMWCLASLIVSILAFGLLILVERRASMPIVKAELLQNKLFVIASTCGALVIFSVWSVFFLLPLFLQTQWAFTPLHTGVVLLFIALPLVILSPLVGRWAYFERSWRFILIGFLFLVLSMFIQLHFGATGMDWEVVVVALSFGIGWSFAWGPVTALALSRLPKSQTGIASGTYNTFQEIGGTLGVSITVLLARGDAKFLHGFFVAICLLFVLMVVGVVLSLIIRTWIKRQIKLAG